MTWVRQTSQQAYQQIKAQGLLSKQRLAVYEWLYINGPATASQIEYGLRSKDSHKRTSELRDQGAVTEAYEASCPITGQQAIFWDVTCAIPTPYVPKGTQGLTRNQLIEKINKLQAENEDLKRQLYSSPSPVQQSLSFVCGQSSFDPPYGDE